MFKESSANKSEAGDGAKDLRSEKATPGRVLTQLPDAGRSKILTGHINVYAAIAVSMLVTILEIVFVISALFSLNTVKTSFLVSLLGFVAFMVALVIFFVAPLVLNRRYQWPTILTTYLIQSVSIYMALVIAFSIAGDMNLGSSSSYYDDYPIQRDCVNC